MEYRRKIPWLCNYRFLSLGNRHLEDRNGFWMTEIYLLAILARGVNRLIDSETITGNRLNERI